MEFIRYVVQALKLSGHNGQKGFDLVISCMMWILRDARSYGVITPDEIGRIRKSSEFSIERFCRSIVEARRGVDISHGISTAGQHSHTA